MKQNKSEGTIWSHESWPKAASVLWIAAFTRVQTWIISDCCHRFSQSKRCVLQLVSVCLVCLSIYLSICFSSTLNPFSILFGHRVLSHGVFPALTRLFHTPSVPVPQVHRTLVWSPFQSDSDTDGETAGLCSQHMKAPLVRNRQGLCPIAFQISTWNKSCWVANRQCNIQISKYKKTHKN